MTRHSLLGLGVAAALICSIAGASAKDTPSQKFIMKAVEGNLAEVQMGQLAQQNGASDGVRSFGQMLQQDHSAAAQKSSAVASQLGVTPPTEPNKKHKAMHDKMAKLSGDKFDKAFASEMVKDHKKDIADYKKAAKMQNDPAGAYANDTLPTLEKHLETAQSLAKKR
jgi:putative membrane protein